MIKKRYEKSSVSLPKKKAAEMMPVIDIKSLRSSNRELNLEILNTSKLSIIQQDIWWSTIEKPRPIHWEGEIEYRSWVKLIVKQRCCFARRTKPNCPPLRSRRTFSRHLSTALNSVAMGRVPEKDVDQFRNYNDGALLFFQ